jgi:hypothetical protein
MYIDIVDYGIQYGSAISSSNLSAWFCSFFSVTSQLLRYIDIINCGIQYALTISVLVFIASFHNCFELFY